MSIFATPARIEHTSSTSSKYFKAHPQLAQPFLFDDKSDDIITLNRLTSRLPLSFDALRDGFFTTNSYFRKHELPKQGNCMLILLQELREAIMLFIDLLVDPSAAKMAKFDPHVGDCGCQIRATLLLLLLQAYLAEKDSMISILEGISQQVAVAINNLSSLNYEQFRLQNYTRFQFLVIAQATVKVSSQALCDHLEFLAVAYVLTSFRENRDDKFGFRHESLASWLDASQQKFFSSLQKQLAQISVNFLRLEATQCSDLPPDFPFNTFVENSLKGVPNVATFISAKILLEVWEHYQIPIQLNIQHVCSNGTHNCSEVYMLEKGQLVTENYDALFAISFACFSFNGNHRDFSTKRARGILTTLHNNDECFEFQNWRKGFLASEKAAGIMGFFANHAQFVGYEDNIQSLPEKKLLCKLQLANQHQLELQYSASFVYALEHGFCRSSMRTLLLEHSFPTFLM